MADKQYAFNRKALHDYHVLDKVEAGLVLTGPEVKSVRSGHISLREAYARIENGEAWLVGAHIAPYSHGNRYNSEPTRPRKLLLHHGELAELGGKVKQGGVTLVPLRVYDSKGHVKVELALARGKKQWDKRESIAQREAQRDIQRAIRERERA